MPEPQMTPLVCDCHIHSFAKDLQATPGRYAPPCKDLTDYLPEARSCRIARAVVVQASVDGTDNSRLIETLRSAPGIELRGVAMIDPESGPLDAFHAAGVRALRIQDRTRLGRHDLALLPQLARRAAEAGWHVELNTEPERFGVLANRLRDLPTDLAIVLDHIGHVDPAQAGQVSGLCELLDTGRVWVKLAPTRVSRHADYRDLADIVSRIATNYPDRCVWGSDWPHVMTEPPLPEIATMLRFFAETLSPAQWRAVMWSNPERLYGF